MNYNYNIIQTTKINYLINSEIQYKLMNEFEGYLIYCLFKYLITYNSYSINEYYENKISYYICPIKQLYINNNNNKIDKLFIPLNINFLYLNKNIYKLSQYKNLIILHLGPSFKDKIDYFPPNLKVLILPIFYNQNINFPNTLEYLELSQDYNHYPYFPINLKVLIIKIFKNINNNIYNILDNLPISLISLSIYTDKIIRYDNLPCNLKYLRINIDLLYVKINLSNLPPNLEFLELNNIDEIEENISNIPLTLKIIKLSYYSSKKTYYQRNKNNLYEQIISTLKKKNQKIKFILETYTN